MVRCEIAAGPLPLDECLARWQKLDLGRRLWQRDPGLWLSGVSAAAPVPGISDRLGWLDLPESMVAETVGLTDFAAGMRAAGFRRVVVLGMGGSSLISEVWERVFGSFAGGPPLCVLDSTHPAAVAAVEAAAPLEKTLFLVASKSGSTLETLSLCDYFYARLKARKVAPGENFVALTDPGSRLESLARQRAFRCIFATPPEVGGRFSALTPFGLLPAALKGIDPAMLLAAAREMARRCGPETEVNVNPALRLGALWGAAAARGIDKLGLLFSPRLAPVAVWLEQLLAESTGKQGRGLLPLALPLADFTAGRIGEWEGCDAGDRAWLLFGLAGDDDAGLERAWQRLKRAGRPAGFIGIESLYELGGELWRFEFACAAAAVELGINPFDQPDVEAAKAGARRALERRADEGCLPEPEGRLAIDIGPEKGIRLFVGAEGGSAAPPALAPLLENFLAAAGPGGYLALLAYLPDTPRNRESLERLRRALAERCRVPVLLCFGPRYLHSTGQLFKGGPAKGLFLQLLGELGGEELPLPGREYGFRTLVTAQARGEFTALLRARRRVLLLEAPGLDGPGFESLLTGSL